MFARIPNERIRDNPFQMRMQYGDLADIAASLLKLKASRPATSGLIQVPPARVVVDSGRVLNPAEYGGVLPCLGDEPEAWVELAAGHRRFRAFQQLHENGGDGDFATFPVEVQVIEDAAMADIAWQENARRKDLSPVEEAKAIRRAMDEFGYSLKEVAERWDISKSAASNKLRLLHLPEKVQALIQAGYLSERHARELLPLVQVAQSPKSATAVAQRAARGEWSALMVADEVKTKLHKLTRQIQPEMLEWEDWGDVALPEECNIVCKGCPREVRGKCSKPSLWSEKSASWTRRLQALASEKTGLPAIDGITVDAPTLPHAQQEKCKNLGIGYKEYAYRAVQVDKDLPNVYYVCAGKWQCECARAQKQAEMVETDPQQAEYQKWQREQEERARQIKADAMAHLKASFQAALNWMPGDDYLRLFVATIKGADKSIEVRADDVDDVAEALATVAWNRCMDYTRVGSALVHRAKVFHLAGLAPSTDEVEAHLQVLRDVLHEVELRGGKLASWQYNQSLERAHEILDALPGHKELQKELAGLEASIEAFSQENEIRQEITR